MVNIEQIQVGEDTYNILAMPQVSYSTAEQNTGRTWIDGKPIYQKTILVTLQNNGIYDVSSSHIETLVDIFGRLSHTNGNQCHIPYGAGNSDYVHLFLEDNKNDIKCVLAGSWNISQAYITFQYTKTTD